MNKFAIKKYNPTEILTEDNFMDLFSELLQNHPKWMHSNDVEDEYINGKSGYRLYKDGWLEQWIYINPVTYFYSDRERAIAHIYFLITYDNLDYNVFYTRPAIKDHADTWTIDKIEKDYVDVASEAGGDSIIYLYVTGYINEKKILSKKNIKCIDYQTTKVSLATDFSSMFEGFLNSKLFEENKVSYNKGTSGYYIYPNGFCEQWSRLDVEIAASAETEAHLLIPYADDSYAIASGMMYYVGWNRSGTSLFSNKTNKGFTLRNDSCGRSKYIYWHTYGFIKKYNKTKLSAYNDIPVKVVTDSVFNETIFDKMTHNKRFFNNFLSKIKYMYSSDTVSCIVFNDNRCIQWGINYLDLPINSEFKQELLLEMDNTDYVVFIFNDYEGTNPTLPDDVVNDKIYTKNFIFKTSGYKNKGRIWIAIGYAHEFNYYKYKEVEWKQPKLLANEQDGIIVTANAEYYPAWKALDGIDGEGTNCWFPNTVTGWWQIKFPYKLKITALTHIGGSYDGRVCELIGRYYTDSSLKIPIGNEINGTYGQRDVVPIVGIPKEGIITDTIYFNKTGGQDISGIGELRITATKMDLIPATYDDYDVYQ